MKYFYLSSYVVYFPRGPLLRIVLPCMSENSQKRVLFSEWGSHLSRSEIRLSLLAKMLNNMNKGTFLVTHFMVRKYLGIYLETLPCWHATICIGLHGLRGQLAQECKFCPSLNRVWNYFSDASGPLKGTSGGPRHCIWTPDCPLKLYCYLALDPPQGIHIVKSR